MPSQDAKLVPWLQAWGGGKEIARDFWTGAALVCWCLWTHRNDVVFDGAAPSPAVVLSKISVEADLWRIARLFRSSLAPVDRWIVRE